MLINVLIHGWGKSPEIMKKIGENLDFPNSKIIYLGYKTTRINNFNDIIEPLKNELIEQISENDTVNFIGHSLGGIIARFLIPYFLKQTKTLITLGTPHKGTKFVNTMKKNKFLNTQLDNVARLLSLNSPFIQSIPEVPDNICKICIAGKKRFSWLHSPSYVSLLNYEKTVNHDGMVEIESTQLKNCKQYIVFENHSKLPLNEEINEIIKKEILNENLLYINQSFKKNIVKEPSII